MKKQELPDNLLGLHGARFSALIEGTWCVGAICVKNGVAYLCQNAKQGAGCEEKFGYKYGWIVDTGSMEDMRKEGVTDFCLSDDDVTYKSNLGYFAERYTKREYFAGLAMSCFIPFDEKDWDKNVSAKKAVEYADALLEELSKTEKL